MAASLNRAFRIAASVVIYGCPAFLFLNCSPFHVAPTNFASDAVSGTQPTNWVTAGNFSVAGSVAKTTMAAGQIQVVKISVKSEVAMTGLIVGVKYLDGNGAYLFEKQYAGVNLAAGVARDFDSNYALRADAPSGTYSIAVGVWGANYEPTHVYQPNLPSYQVTAIPQPPPPNQGPLPINNLPMTSVVDQFLYAGPYWVQNNMWGSGGLAAGSFYENAGIGPLTANNSISARWNWSYPDGEPGPNYQEVKGYPAVGIGQKPGQFTTPGSNLPKLVDSIQSAVCAWDTQAVYSGRGQLVFDLWLTRDAMKYPNFPQTPITHEIMLAVDSFGGYATANPAWYFGSTVIDGIVYRVWKADGFPGVAGLSWRFIVLSMVNPTTMTKGSINFKGIFTYLKSAGLITGQEYLSSIEFGNEMQYGTGDVFIKDFKATVN